jgi:hypothetical protein
MIQHDVERVKSITADVFNFDFRSIAPISFCLLDVDLYLPIKNTLPKILRPVYPFAIT